MLICHFLGTLAHEGFSVGRTSSLLRWWCYGGAGYYTSPMYSQELRYFLFDLNQSSDGISFQGPAIHD